MAIINPDGSAFKASGSLNQFDPNSPRNNFFNRIGAESIRIGGTPINYYEVFIQFQTIDELYLEDRGKVWSPIPLNFYVYYEPFEPQNPSTQFGIDGPGDVMFEANREAVIAAIGHMPKRGSRINTPHMNENWVIVDVRAAQFNYWGKYQLQIICERFRESLTDASSIHDKPDYTIF